MDENQKQNLFLTFKGVLDSIILDKKKKPKNLKTLNSFEAKINLCLHVHEDEYFWMNLVAKDGNFELSRGKFEGEHDLSLIVTPEDMLYYSNREYSTLHMVTKKNQYGNKKLKIQAGTTGHNVGLLLKLPKVFVLDKDVQDKVFDKEKIERFLHGL